MKILGNGLIEIKNKNSGEIKQVQPEELASYSPFLANQYNSFMDKKKKNEEDSDPTAFIPGGAGVAGMSSFLTGGSGMDLGGLDSFLEDDITPVQKVLNAKIGKLPPIKLQGAGTTMQTGGNQLASRNVRTSTPKVSINSKFATLKELGLQ